MEDSGRIAKWSLEDIGASVPWLRDQLVAEDINIHPRSALNLALERLATLKGMATVGATFRFPSRLDAYEFFSDAVGADFLTKMLHRGVKAGVKLDRHRLRHCVAGEPIVTRPGGDSDDRNRLWETVLACAAATFSADVRFDEPDVTCEFEGRRFGVAAKLVRSVNRLWKNVGKGAAQASGRSEAAIVAVNVVDLLPLQDLFIESTARRAATPANTVAWLKDWATHWCDQPALRQMAIKLKERSNQIIGVTFFMPFLVQLEEQPVPFFYTHMPLVWGENTTDFAFAKAFLGACNTVLGFAGAA